MVSTVLQRSDDFELALKHRAHINKFEKGRSSQVLRYVPSPEQRLGAVGERSS